VAHRLTRRADATILDPSVRPLAGVARRVRLGVGMGRRLARIAVFAAAITTVLALAVAVALRTSAAQRAIGERVRTALDDEIQGTVEIDEYVEVGPAELRVRGLRVLDERGTAVLHIDEAVLAPDLGALFDRRIAFRSAQATRATVLLTREDHDQLQFERAFHSAHPDDDDGGGFRIDLRAIHVRDLRIELGIGEDVRGGCDIETGRVSVSTLSEAPVIRFATGVARCEMSQPEVALDLAAARGVFDGDATDRLVLVADGRVGGAPLPFELTLLDGGGGDLRPHLRVDLEEAGIEGRVMVIGLTLMQLGSPELRVVAPARVVPPDPAK
jgi:hypothetical protein